MSFTAGRSRYAERCSLGRRGRDVGVLEPCDASERPRTEARELARTYNIGSPVLGTIRVSKTRGHHADNRANGVTQAHRPADDAGIAAEPALPEPVAQHEGGSQ